MRASTGNKHLSRPPLTKLTPPTCEARRLARPEVLASLCRVRESKLALLTAPTGSGKSTLLAETYAALAAEGLGVCWLSLDAADNLITRFLVNLIHALQRARPPLGGGEPERLVSSVAPGDVLTGVIDELTTRAMPIVLFLDDYQEIENPEVHAAVSYLLQYSPASMHLVISGQKEPPLAIARLRARAAVLEIGFEQLRLTPVEIREYLAKIGRLDLTEPQVRALAEHTEGWICGLQLATIALAGPGAMALAEAGAAGGRFDFADKVLEDILARQPAEVQQFLLRTSVLSQFSAGLADAVTGAPGSEAMIAAIERANLLLVRLDREQTWFRYHHLFSGFLRKRLAQREPDLAAKLALRAARWYREHAMHSEALRYALAGGHTELAAELLERYGRELLRAGDLNELARWLEAIPPAAIRGSAVLCVLEAWTRLYLGDPVAAGVSIQAAEQAIAAGPQKRVLSDELHIQRAMTGVTRYDLPDVAGLRDDLPGSFGPEDALQRAYAYVVLGYAARLAGDLDAAAARYTEAVRISDLSEDTVVNLIARYNVAIVHWLRADPATAVEGLQLWLRDPRNKRWLRAGSAGFLHAAAAIMALECGELATALTEASEAIELLDATRTYAYVGIALTIRAQVLAQSGDLQASGSDLARARSAGKQGLDRLTFRACLAGARNAVRLGQWQIAMRDLRQARAVLERTGQLAMPLQTENMAAYASAYAGLLLARSRWDDASRLCDESLVHAERAGRIRHAIEFLACRSVARLGLGDADGAARAFDRAVDLAAPGQAVYPFAIAGRGVLPLLDPFRAEGAHTAFAERVAAALASRATPVAASGRGSALHQREIQILKLVELGLRNRDIGERLFISEDTVKWYLKRTYDALQVGNRVQALARARDLGLIDP